MHCCVFLCGKKKKERKADCNCVAALDTLDDLPRMGVLITGTENKQLNVGLKGLMLA